MRSRLLNWQNKFAIGSTFCFGAFAFLSYGLNASFLVSNISLSLLFTRFISPSIFERIHAEIIAVALLCVGLTIDTLLVDVQLMLWVLYALCAASILSPLHALVAVFPVIFGLGTLTDLLTLSETSGLVVVSMMIVGLNLRISVLSKALHTRSGFDDVYGCKNRQTFNEDARQSWNITQRYKIPTSMVVIDLSAHSDIEVYEKSASSLVEVWRTRLRNTDMLYKVSDRRFVCLLSTTDKGGAETLVADLNKAVQAYEQPMLQDITVEMAVYSSTQATSLDTWLAMAYHHDPVPTNEKS